MRFRGLPGALVLGLLASIAAHAAAFGDGHAQAGALHDAFFGLAAWGLTALAAGAAACAAFGSSRCRDGSVLACRLAAYLPSLTGVALSGTAWFVLGEALDEAHAPGSLALIVAALVLAVLAVHALAAILLRALASIAIAIRRIRFAPRRPSRVDRLRRAAQPRRITLARRVVTRPPPNCAIVSA